MAPKPIPDRWLNYQPIGQRIMGTRFIAFKVPLTEHVTKSVQDDLRLSCDSLLKRIPNLGMIIDLTNTNRYYDPYFFKKLGVRYEKLMIPGHEIPPRNSVQKFIRMVHDYLRENANNTTLIGVHCTHGVNRTGYLICNFMVSEMKIDPVEAIQSFEAARGHRIERQNYRNDLMRCVQSNFVTSSREPRQTNWRTRSPHQSKDTRACPSQESTDPFGWRRSGSPRQSWRSTTRPSQEADSNRYTQRSRRDRTPKGKDLDRNARLRDRSHRPPPPARRQESNRFSALS